METPSGGIDAGALRALRRARAGTARAPSGDPASGFDNGGGPLIGTSRAMTALRAKIELVADARRTTLLVGPTGSGKEVVARSLQARSARATEPFVSVHCAALPESLVEAELFGHARGAFTGAIEHRAGLVRTASQGTLFLDEIDSLSLGTQAKLLRFLELGEYRAVGSDRVERSSAWVIAATNQDLHGRVDRGLFRADLLYRLDVVRIEIPSLLERGADEILALAEHFLWRVARLRGIELWLDASARTALVAHDWPGNVRELKNRVESAALLGAPGRIDASRLGLPARRSALPPSYPLPPAVTPTSVRDRIDGRAGALSETVSPSSAPPHASPSLDTFLWELVAVRGLSLAEAVDECERSLIRAALRAAGENRSRAATLLGIHVRTLYKKLDGGD